MVDPWKVLQKLNKFKSYHTILKYEGKTTKYWLDPQNVHEPFLNQKKLQLSMWFYEKCWRLCSAWPSYQQDYIDFCKTFLQHWNRKNRAHFHSKDSTQNASFSSNFLKCTKHKKSAIKFSWDNSFQLERNL